MSARALLIATALLPLVGCASSQHRAAELQNWMTGSFSSASQHQQDPENYFEINLHMAPIWTERSDGPWLYVEQAAAARPERPYRQRVYHLIAREDGRFESVVYELPGDPLTLVGAWKEPERLDEITPDDLTLREGCRIILRREDAAYVGSTNEQDCLSTLRGASYATSEVTIESSQLVSWDRGYNAEHEQVWGATAGGYVFEKLPTDE